MDKQLIRERVTALTWLAHGLDCGKNYVDEIDYIANAIADELEKYQSAGSPQKEVHPSVESVQAVGDTYCPVMGDLSVGELPSVDNIGNYTYSVKQGTNCWEYLIDYAGQRIHKGLSPSLRQAKLDARCFISGRIAQTDRMRDK